CHAVRAGNPATQEDETISENRSERSVTLAGDDHHEALAALRAATGQDVASTLG
ncbi:MAG: hypothetical protein ACJAZO_003875, partial [Myxococcota bacterium]